VDGIESAGLKACAKHFPGLGDVSADPHHKATQCTASLETFREIHFQPFKAAVRSGVTAVMTTHLYAPSLDSNCIATYSKQIVHKLLQDELSFRHLILTDDLEMGAVPDSPPEAAWYAFEAGHHLLLLCHDQAQQSAALALFRTRLSGDSEARRRLHSALDRQEPYRRPFEYAFA
jgi:beta-N-acetylhexosaminidase